MSELLWFSGDPPRNKSATCKHEKLQDSDQIENLTCHGIKVCLKCRKGFVEGKSLKVMVNGWDFFDVPENATKDEVMKIACDVVGTYGEDIDTITVYKEEPKVKWRETYFDYH